MSGFTPLGVAGLVLALLGATTLGFVEPFCEITPPRRSVQVIAWDKLPPIALRTWVWACLRARLLHLGGSLAGLFLVSLLLGPSSPLAFGLGLSLILAWGRLRQANRWIDFSALPPCPHPHGLDPAVYVETFLVALEERHTQSFERFHRFLVEHPAWILLLGYRPQGVDPTKPFGFDPEATLVSARHLKRKLQEFPHAYIPHLLLHTGLQLAAAGLLKECIAAVSVGPGRRL